MNTVNFPELGIYLNLNPVAFRFMEKPIYWYGIIIAFGLFCGVLFAMREERRVGLPKDTVLDVALIGTPTAIVFARLYYVIFNLHEFDSIADMFKIWEGGLAIYGGIIGAVLSAWIYCCVKKVPTLEMFDIGAPSLLIGQMIGRWGNFVNAEAYGIPTDLPWRMEVMEGSELIAVHPTFLYESLWNLIGFIILFCYRKHKKFSGEIFLMYIAWYGLGRSWIEALRADSLPYGADFKISQIVAVLSVIAAVVIWIYLYRKAKTAQTEK